ncbi:unnamed protein product [Amoebophrya sp. A120]|nr:unnamed protein product [Amoebophrya sp. A120]|eukprot:GSA120T00014582001.1
MPKRKKDKKSAAAAVAADSPEEDQQESNEQPPAAGDGVQQEDADMQDVDAFMEEEGIEMPDDGTANLLSKPKKIKKETRDNQITSNRIPVYPIWGKEEFLKTAAFASDKNQAIIALSSCISFILDFSGLGVFAVTTEDIPKITKPLLWVEDLPNLVEAFVIEQANAQAGGGEGSGVEDLELLGGTSAGALGGAGDNLLYTADQKRAKKRLALKGGFAWNAPAPEAYAIVHKKTALKARNKLDQWFPNLAANMKPMDFIATGFLANFVLWLEALYASPYICLRHTATVVAGSVLSEITKILADLEQQLDIALKQYKNEEKNSNSLRKDFLKKEISENSGLSDQLVKARDHLLRNFKQTRLKDQNEKIRFEAVCVMKRVVSRDLSLFDEDLARVLECLLVDPDAGVRMKLLEMVEDWVKMYEKDREAMAMYCEQVKEKYGDDPGRMELLTMGNNGEEVVDEELGYSSGEDDFQTSNNEEDSNDPNQQNQNQSLLALKKRQRQELLQGGPRHFWKRLQSRKMFKKWIRKSMRHIRERCGDVEEKVAIQAVRTVTLRWIAERFLTDTEFDAVVCLVFCGRTVKVRKQAALFVNSHVFSEPGIEDLVDHSSDTGLDQLRLEDDNLVGDGSGNENFLSNSDNEVRQQLQQASSANSNANKVKKMNPTETNLLMFLEFLVTYCEDAVEDPDQETSRTTQYGAAIYAVQAYWNRTSCITAFKTQVAMFFLSEDNTEEDADVNPLTLRKKVALLVTMEAALTILQQTHQADIQKLQIDQLTREKEEQQNKGFNAAGPVNSTVTIPSSLTNQQLCQACFFVLPKLPQFFDSLASEKYGKLIFSNICEILLRHMLENPDKVPSSILASNMSDVVDALENILEEQGAQNNNPLLYGNISKCYRHLALISREAADALGTYLRNKQEHLKSFLDTYCTSPPADFVEDASPVDGEEDLQHADNYDPAGGAVAAEANVVKQNKSRKPKGPRLNRVDQWLKVNFLDPDAPMNLDGEIEQVQPGQVALQYPARTFELMQYVERAVEIHAHLGCFLNHDLIQQLFSLLRFTSVNRLPRQLLIPLAKLVQVGLNHFVVQATSGKVESFKEMKENAKELKKSNSPSRAGGSASPKMKKKMNKPNITGGATIISAHDEIDKRNNPLAFFSNYVEDEKTPHFRSARIIDAQYTASSSARVNQHYADVILELNNGNLFFLNSRQMDDYLESEISAITAQGHSERNLAYTIFEFRHLLITRLLKKHRDVYVKHLAVNLYFDSLQMQYSLQNVLRMDPIFFEDPAMSTGGMNFQEDESTAGNNALKQVCHRLHKTFQQQGNDEDDIDENVIKSKDDVPVNIPKLSANMRPLYISWRRRVKDRDIQIQGRAFGRKSTAKRKLNLMGEEEEAGGTTSDNNPNTTTEEELEAEFQYVCMNPVLVYEDHEVLLWTYFYNLFLDIKDRIQTHTMADYQAKLRITQEMVKCDKITFPSEDSLESYIPPQESGIRSVTRSNLAGEDYYTVIEHLFHKACMKHTSTHEGMVANQYIPENAFEPKYNPESDSQTADPTYVKQDAGLCGLRDLLTMGLSSIKLVDQSCESDHIKNGPIGQLIGAQFGVLRMIPAIKEASKSLFQKMRKEADKNPVLAKQYFHFISTMLGWILEMSGEHAYMDIRQSMIEITRTWVGRVGETQLPEHLVTAFQRCFVELQLSEANCSIGLNGEQGNPSSGIQFDTMDVDLLYNTLLPCSRFMTKEYRGKVEEFLGRQMISLTSQKTIAKLRDLIERLRLGPGHDGTGLGVKVGKKRGRKAKSMAGMEPDVMAAQGQGAFLQGEPEQPQQQRHIMDEDEDLEAAPAPKRIRQGRDVVDVEEEGVADAGGGNDDEDDGRGPTVRHEDIVDEEDDLLADEYLLPPR